MQEFIQRKSREKRLKDRLHVIWLVSFRYLQLQFRKVVFRFCIPMDNDRPSLDMKHFDDICQDKNGMSIATIVYRNWE